MTVGARARSPSRTRRAAFTSCELVIGGGRWAPSEARHALAEWADGSIEPDALETLLLLLSELVTNCVRHGGASDGAPVRVAAANRTPCVRVEVSSDGPPFDFAPRRPDAASADSRGLYLVDALAARWGIAHGPPPVAWFELDRG